MAMTLLTRPQGRSQSFSARLRELRHDATRVVGPPCGRCWKEGEHGVNDAMPGQIGWGHYHQTSGALTR